MRGDNLNVKKDNFKRISENRINKIVDMISKLSNLINPSFYEYDDDEIKAMFDRIELEIKKQKDIFKNDSKKKNKRIKL